MGDCSNWRLFALLVAANLLGCAPERIESHPETWPKLHTGSYSDIPGDYSNKGGVSTLATDETRTIPRLQFWLFRFSNSSLEIEKVRLRYVPKAEELQASFYSASGVFAGETSISLRCEDGVLREGTVSEIHGEFTQGKAAIATELLLDDEGSLVMHTRIKTSQTDFILFPYSRNEELWARFKKIDSRPTDPPTGAAREAAPPSEFKR